VLPPIFQAPIVYSVANRERPISPTVVSIPADRRFVKRLVYLYAWQQLLLISRARGSSAKHTFSATTRQYRAPSKPAPTRRTRHEGDIRGKAEPGTSPGDRNIRSCGRCSSTSGINQPTVAAWRAILRAGTCLGLPFIAPLLVPRGRRAAQHHHGPAFHPSPILLPAGGFPALAVYRYQGGTSPRIFRQFLTPVGIKGGS